MQNIKYKILDINGNINVSIFNNVLVCSSKFGSNFFVIPKQLKIIKKQQKLILFIQNINKNKKFYNGYFFIIYKKLRNIIYFYKQIFKLKGLGFKGDDILNNNINILKLKIGFSHFIEFKIPSDIKLFPIKKNNLIVIGIDKQRVSEIIKKIQIYLKPDIYKGNGIQILHETLLLKEKKK